MLYLLVMLGISVVFVVAFSLWINYNRVPSGGDRAESSISDYEMLDCEAFIKRIKHILYKNNIWFDSDGDIMQPEALASALHVCVKENDSMLNEQNKESLLSKSNDDCNGYIYVKSVYSSDNDENLRERNFRIAHEIIHYLRDVGIGKKVQSSYAREVSGATKPHDEQLVDYMAAALFIPLDYVQKSLTEYDLERLAHNEVVNQLHEKFAFSDETVKRRVSEVRRIGSCG